MKFKPVFRYDSSQKKLRLFRFLWTRGTVGDGLGYSAKLSFALTPKLYGFKRNLFDWRATFLGVQVHRLRAYGGIIP